MKNVLRASLHCAIEPEVPETDYPALGGSSRVDEGRVRLVKGVPRSKVRDSYMPNHLPVIKGSNLVVYLTKHRQEQLGVEQWANEYEPLLAEVILVHQPGLYQCKWYVACTDLDDLDGACDGYSCRWKSWAPGPPDDRPFYLTDDDILAKNFEFAKDGSLFTVLQKEIKRLIYDRYAGANCD